MLLCCYDWAVWHHQNLMLHCDTVKLSSKQSYQHINGDAWTESAVLAVLLLAYALYGTSQE